MKDWELVVETVDGLIAPISYEELECLKDPAIPVEDYVPRKQAEAVSFFDIVKAKSISTDFSHVVFTAEDGFHQRVAKEELEHAFFVFKQKGQPLTKGYPVRLYVPGSDSDCYNVKSVVRMGFLKE